MNREEKNKFGNFVHEQRKKEEEVLEICQDIFANSRNELAVSMRYFQSALSALKIVPSGETQVLGTDGKLLYVSPQWLLPMFMQNKVVINRLYLHELLHCLSAICGAERNGSGESGIWQQISRWKIFWMNFIRRQFTSARTVSEEKNISSGK